MYFINRFLFCIKQAINFSIHGYTQSKLNYGPSSPSMVLVLYLDNGYSLDTYMEVLKAANNGAIDVLYGGTK